MPPFSLRFAPLPFHSPTVRPCTGGEARNPSAPLTGSWAKAFDARGRHTGLNINCERQNQYFTARSDPAVSDGLDDKFGVPYGSGLPIALLALAVLMQYVALGITLARIFGLLN